MFFDYLPNINLKITQQDGMFKINSDTVALGQFMKIKHQDDVLDIGTNNGALLLYAAQAKPKSLTGIDIQEQAIEVAKGNMKLHDIEANLIVSSLQTFEHEPFDVIVCNPPYFKTDEKWASTKEESIKTARYDDYLPLPDLLAGYARLLKDSGRVYMIYPANRTQELMIKMVEYNLRIKTMRPVYDSRKEYAIVMLMEIVKGKANDIKIESPLIR